jgi:uncharacterized protein (TIGR02757 family)
MRGALERLRSKTLADGRVERDPIRVVLDYETAEDREVVGLLAALLAYGRVDAMRAHTRELLSHLGRHPAERLRDGVPRLKGIRYRFHRASDLRALLRGVRALLLRHGTLREAFDRQWHRHGELKPTLAAFVEEIRQHAGASGPGLTFLLADPARGGACKRWHLYLRWMIRSEPGDPDPGVWNGAHSPSILLVPLDTHLVRVSRRLGFTGRRTVNWKMAEEVTAALRRFSPEDPVRYDFPLCHLGIAGICPPSLTAEHCRCCPLQGVCPTAKRGQEGSRRPGGRWRERPPGEGPPAAGGRGGRLERRRGRK